MNHCLSDEATLRRLAEELEQARPRPHHSTLLTAARQILPSCSFHHALSRGGWYRPGGVIQPDGTRLALELEPWLDAEMEACGGDLESFLERHMDAGLLATRQSGRTHYFVSPYGPGPADFMQLEVEELQEVLDRRLFDPEDPPADLEELKEPLLPETLEAQPVGHPRYRFRRLSDMRQVLARLPAPVGQQAPLARFVAEWARSSAAGRGHFSDHWIIAVREHQDRYRNNVLSATPVSLHARQLKTFPWNAEARGVALSDQIHAFDRAAGYPAAWYFHLVSGAITPHEIAHGAMLDLLEGYGYLPEADAALLEGWANAPYSA